MPAEGAVVTNTAQTARSMWILFEPIHAVTYFAPEARSAFEQAGLRGFWRGTSRAGRHRLTPRARRS